MEKGGKPVVVAFVAWSGTGKTTLIEQLIALAARRGQRVGALKHDAHGFEIDKPGKDSHRFGQAGAGDTVIVADDKLALIRRHDAAPPVEELLARHFADCDIVFVEGWKNAALPRIEVYRPELGRPLLCRGQHDDPYLIAVAAPGDLGLDVPTLPLDRPDQILAFVDERLQPS
jgi:molybdopterin-guanine dinucleotide biosynthesis protein B/molybdopterin-guanine dinucleotide biosynthesis protein